MKNSLLWRFVVIFSVMALAIVCVELFPLRPGIDLAGGTSLLYELDMEKAAASRSSPQELAQQVIAVLKQRVDPGGQMNLIWRVVGGKRIQVQMPLPSKETRNAKLALEKAEQAILDTSLKQSEVQSALSKTGAARDAAIAALAPPGNPRHDQLLKLAAAQDELAAVNAEAAKYAVGQTPTDLLGRKIAAQKAVAAAKSALEELNVDLATLKSVVTAADNPKNTEAQQALDAIVKNHTSQRQEIQTYIESHRKLMELNGGGVEDSADLQRMITSSGVLDFRITVNPMDVGYPDGELYQQALKSLKDNGPNSQMKLGGIVCRWFQVNPNWKDNFDRVGFVTGTWAGEPYVLCYDDATRALTHAEGRRPWSVQADRPYYDPTRGEIMPFHLDPIGARMMGDLTGDNIGRPMCILLDDKAMSAPTINDRISANGEITFGMGNAHRSIDQIRKEAEDLKQLMDAGSLPATLQSQPISVQEITPDMGSDNISAGIHSAIYALIAVLAFMLLYYTITGVFANLALMFNLLLVLAAMAFSGATFTLPGIAGLVLTLGMAVDANVLINERIREELHKGASLWMAVRQGYDKVFWTIFDANLTTSLTSIVLIYVGSEEVKGFGVTLLIGLAIHMFTALFVTRTLMMAAIKWGIVRAIDDHSIGEYLREIFTFTWIRNGHWPFMKVITVSNFDWIGKRYFFWGISAIITVAGLWAFVARGEDKYDIEFRGGTQVTFQLKENPTGGYLSLDQVRKRIENLGSLPGLADLRSARVYGVGKPEVHRYEMQTTVSNPKDNPGYVKATLLDPLAKAFSDVLDITPAVTFDGDRPGDLVTAQQINSLMDRGIVVPLTGGSLDQAFAHTEVQGIPNRDVTDFIGGTGVLLNNMSPPQTAAQLEDRIRTERQSPDLHIPYRDFRIIPVTAVAGGNATPAALEGAAGAASQPLNTVPATEKDLRPLTRAVMVSLDTAKRYDPDNESNWKDNAASEWQVVSQALSKSNLFAGVTSFDAVVAGQAKMQALMAIVLSLILILIYVWIRFGSIRYGVGAILSLGHDAVVALAATVLSGEIYDHVFGGHPNWFLISDFKINLTMIAAYLTIIGYSVNDTIVIFDRVRELRGKGNQPLTKKLVNDAINQCFGRTIWTTFTVFIVVLIMYIFGGEGIRGFSFAMLIGVLTGAYSTLAIASPMLLTTALKSDKGGNRPTGMSKSNPFRPQPASTEGA